MDHHGHKRHHTTSMQGILISLFTRLTYILYRSALLCTLKQANSLGWKLVASADVSAMYVRQDNGPDYPVDVHSWYFGYWPHIQYQHNYSTKIENLAIDYLVMEYLVLKYLQ